jgi:hypothetical protein
MLDLDRVDLRALSTALEDHSDLHSWWIDTTTGEVHLYGDGMWDARRGPRRRRDRAARYRNAS